MSNPLYDVNDVVYFKESAALGFLEAVRISSMMRESSGWIYSIFVGGSGPTAVPHYGDRRSFVNGAMMWYSEEELVTHCDALLLAEANAQRNLARIQAQRAALCSTDTTDGTD